jgi:predicted benzoate:H+ symporter BenE
MNENDLARRIVAHLDQSLAELPTTVAQKLRAARLVAVARYHPPAEALWVHFSAAGILRGWGLGRRFGARLALPIAIVIASLTGLVYWQMSSHHEEELDTGLLAGELPIHAYIDPGFDAWLKHTSHTEQE